MADHLRAPAGRLVLVADDDPETRELVALMLADAGFRTVTAADGEETIGLATARQPAAILLGLMMPGMDGYAAVTRLRHHPSTRRIPIIVLTGQEASLLPEVSVGLGVAASMTKPLSPTLLVETLRQVLVERTAEDGDQSGGAGAESDPKASASRALPRVGEAPRPEAVGVGGWSASPQALVRPRGDGAPRPPIETDPAGRREAEVLTERLSVLHAIDRAIIAAESPVAIAEAVIQRFRDLLGVPRAIVNLFDLATGEAEWLAAAGRQRVHVGPGVRFPLALMGDVEALQRGEPQVIDVDALPRSREAEALLTSGVHVYMVVPMIAGGELIGGLSFGGESREFPPEQVSIAKEAAAQLAIAISQARLYERVARQAEELEQRVRERTGELSAANEQLAREIGERRRAEADAAQANRLKSQFLATMSHELRTPLNSIIGFTELLLTATRDPLTERQRTALDKVQESGRHLLALINDILDLSKIEAGHMAMRPEPFALPPLVDECLASVEPQAKAKSLSLRAVGLGPGPTLFQDRSRIKQILLNLLSNAVKFTPAGGSVEIRVGREAHGVVTLAVADTGIGIAPEDVGKLFEAFQQIEAAQVEGAGGTGLGLAISRRLARLAGGDLEVESVVGQGSVFTVRLPGGASVQSSPEEPPPEPAKLPAGQHRILIIDDDRNAVELVRTALVDEPVRVEWAASPAGGLTRVRDRRPTLILLDVILHGEEDGWDVLDALKRDPQTRDIPIVIHSVTDNPRRAEQLGADGVMRKPVEPAALRRLIRTLVTRVGEGPAQQPR